MFAIVKEWQSFQIHLPVLETWLKANAGEHYTGNSADISFTMWFSEEPSEGIKSAIDSHWNALTENGEAAKWTLYDNRNLAIEDARTSLLTASFDDLIAAERKLLLGMVLTDDDKDALLLKYPQA
jgi:hypothetical protein